MGVTMAGGKIASSHTTVIEAAVPSIKALNCHSNVDKICLGLIRNKRRKSSSNPYCKVWGIDNGVKVVVCGNATIQVFYIYGQAKYILSLLEDIWGSENMIFEGEISNNKI